MRSFRPVFLWLGLGVLLLLAIVFSAGSGTVSIPPGKVLQILSGFVGLDRMPEGPEVFIITRIRLPRILIAVLVGSSLATAGAVLQGLFRNPMASPDLLGISAGGSLGAVASIHTGLLGSGIAVLPLLTVSGALLASAAVYGLSTRQGRTSLLFIILAGMAISSLLNGIISLILLFSKQYEISQFLFWTMGGLENRRWEHVLISFPPLILCQFLLYLFAHDLNLFLFGEYSAHSLGIPVETRKKIVLFLATVLAGVSVAVSGTIGFVGLLVPHLLRLLIGSDHRVLIPSSALTGGIFLLICDTLGRSLFPPYEIRAGIITAIAGAPYFIYLIVRSQKRSLYG